MGAEPNMCCTRTLVPGFTALPPDLSAGCGLNKFTVALKASLPERFCLVGDTRYDYWLGSALKMWARDPSFFSAVFVLLGSRPLVLSDTRESEWPIGLKEDLKSPKLTF